MKGNNVVNKVEFRNISGLYGKLTMLGYFSCGISCE